MLVLSGLVFLGCVNAFFPTQWMEDWGGKGGVSHVTQTNQAFEQLAAVYFSRAGLTDAMKRARDDISEANAEVDNDQTSSALHFDGENFEGGQNRLVNLKIEVVDALKANKPDAARKSLGGALHTLQDFYAHSNWVELGNNSPLVDLGRDIHIPHATFSDPTCKYCPSNVEYHFPWRFDCPDCTTNSLSLLTSGYYFGEDAPPDGKIPSDKCHHGGAFDSPGGGKTVPFLEQIPYAGINKDSLNCIYSPHSFAHRQAVQISIDSTKQYINDIKALITESQLKALFGVGPTLAFVVDTTSSMSDVIAAVREHAISIAEERLGTPDETSMYIISPFNDPTTGPVTSTPDFTTFKSVISSLTAEGGGDCPELAMSGIAAALDYVDDGASVFMFTDADAKDAEYAEAVTANAQSRNVKIYNLKYDSDCDDSPLKKRHDTRADSVYGSISLATGGQYHSLPRLQANNITGLLGPVTKTNSVYILKVSDTICTTSMYEFVVDTELSEMTLYLRGNTTVFMPDDRSILDLSSAITFNDSKCITIKAPAVGTWAIRATPGQITIDIIGVSVLQFSSFRFVQIAGRPGHTGYFPMNGPPAYDHDVAAVFNIEGANFTDIIFNFWNPGGRAVYAPTFKRGSGEYGEPSANSFFGVFRVPPTSVLAYISGKDSSGAAFQRVLPSLITPYRSNSSITSIGNSTFVSQNFTTIPPIPTASVTVFPPVISPECTTVSPSLNSSTKINLKDALIGLGNSASGTSVVASKATVVRYSGTETNVP